MFININIHSHYSLLNSSISLQQIIDYSLHNKIEYACLSDINNMYACIEFYDLAKKNNLKPIIGLEFDYNKTRLVAYAINYQGYLKLIDWSSSVMMNQDFFVKTSDLENIILIAKTPGIEFDHYNFYQSYDQTKLNAIAVKSVHYLQSKDEKIYKTLLALKNNKKLSDYNDISFDAKLLNQDEATEIFSSNAINNLNKILKQIDLEILNLPSNIPVYDSKNKTTSREILTQLCVEGLIKRLNSKDGKLPINYLQRLKYELEIISEKSFDDYFLIVYDFINFAKYNNIIVGPGRGSAAGSLVAYALYITDIDPILHKLVFERFLNPTRKSMPDIDTDIMDARRDEVINYIFDKYTNDNVSYIVTFQHIKAKMAIRDVGRVLGIDLKVVDKIAKMVDSTYEGTLLELVNSDKKLQKEYQFHEELFEIANSLINFPRQVGTHAAGIILSKDKLRSIIPIQKGIDERPLSQYSMDYLERFGLIKIDLLGLKNLTIIQNVIKRIKKTTNKHIDLAEIDLNDQNVFYDLTQGKTNGIFQLESPGMRNVLMRLKPKTLEDISIVSAIYRPGAQKSIDEFLINKSKPETVSYLNQEIKEILESTYGIIIYQEQVMEIVQKVASFNAAESDNFRRAISKKDEEVILGLKKNFILGAEKNNYSQTIANDIFNYVLRFASYGFNHSHSIAYSYISYFLAYLKHYYPLEFFSVLLTQNASSVAKIKEYVNEIKEYNILMVGPNLIKSNEDFSISVKNNIIYFGFKIIKGFGTELIKKIKLAKESPMNTFEEAIIALKNANISLKNIEILIKIGAFDHFGFNRLFLINNLEEIYNNSLIGDFFDRNYVGLEYANDMQINERYEHDEEEYLGFKLKMLTQDSTMISIINELKKDNIHLSGIADINENSDVDILIKIISVEESLTKKGTKIFFVIGVVNDIEIKLTIFHNNEKLIKKIEINHWYVISVSKFLSFKVISDIKKKVG